MVDVSQYSRRFCLGDFNALLDVIFVLLFLSSIVELVKDLVHKLLFVPFFELVVEVFDLKTSFLVYHVQDFGKSSSAERKITG